VHKKIGFFLSIVALMLVVAACGGNEKESANNAANSAGAAESASTEVVIKASNWEFDQAEYALPKDTPVKLTLENLSGAHGFEIVGTDVKIRGNSSDVVTLPAGTYEIKCNVVCGAGHTKMTSTIVVS
jgi:cytochrome c oxidase subunit 2